MNPLFARNRISDYLDNELSPDEREQFEQALESSQELRQELNSIRQSIQILKRTGPAEAPVDFMDNILNAIQTEPVHTLRVAKPARRSYSMLWPAVAVAAALLTIILIPDEPVAPPPAHMGGILEVTKPTPLELPVNTPSAYELLEAHQPQMPPVAIVDAPSAPQANPDEKTTKSVKLPSVSFIPETPYVPEWEEQVDVLNPEHSDEKLYMLRFAAPDVLYSLEALAERYSGQLVDINNAPLSPYNLDNEQNYARVNLLMPLGQWTDVDEALRHLGTEFRHPLIMQGDDSVLFMVEVSYNP